MGASGAIGGFSVLAEWRAIGISPPKDRDFALGLGAVVVTPDEIEPADRAFDWPAAVDLAAAGTALYPGDVLASPAAEPIDAQPGDVVTVAIDGVGALEQRVA
jgi:2-keto-4-pentenoate hydratase/2-oxohepta-3-ene-1,7-dioic acid hydratase in catechol pathway